MTYEKERFSLCENIAQMALRNTNFCTTVWTGCYAQMTLMCIDNCDEIGVEVHQESDQIIRVEQGKACVKMGECKEHLHFSQVMCPGDVVFIPAGTWHNMINKEDAALKVYLGLRRLFL